MRHVPGSYIKNVELFEIHSSNFQSRGYYLNLQQIKVFHNSACRRQNR